MTALNMMVQPRARAGYLLTDTAISTMTGEVQRFASKVLYGAGRFPWAAGVSGNVMPEVVFKELAEAQPLTLKQLQRRLPEVARRAVAFTAASQGKQEREMLVKIVGIAWDFHRKCPVGFTVTSDAESMVGQTVKPYTWYELDWALGSHIPADQVLCRPVEVTDPDSFDPQVDGLALVAGQRAAGTVNITPGMTAGCVIGGDVDMTEVTKHGVKIYKIGEFPDRVGLVMDPTVGPI